MKDPKLVALTKPLECPYCGGHVALDETFLEQVHDTVVCPYCEEVVTVGSDIIGEEYEDESLEAGTKAEDAK